MTPQTLAAFLFMQNMVVGTVVAWAVDLPIWEGLIIGALLGLGQSALILVGNQRSWLRADLFTKQKRPTVRRMTPSLLSYCIGFSIVAGSSFGLVRGYDFVLWLVSLPLLLLLGIVFAWVLSRVR